jgi:chitinase
MDAGTYYYWYRRKFNIPRVSADRTYELTDYEFEYEFLLEQAFNKTIQEITNSQPINSDDGTFKREFAMDEETYRHILELAENDEYIDFEIPEDAPSARRNGEQNTNVENHDADPVDLKELFGSKGL